MAQKQVKTTPVYKAKIIQRLKEIGFLSLLASSLFLLVAYYTYSPDDKAWSYVNQGAQLHNAGGHLGAWAADLSFLLFGIVAYLFPLLLVHASVQLIRGHKSSELYLPLWTLKITGSLLFILASCGFFSLHLQQAALSFLPTSAGGIFGSLLHEKLLPLLHPFGATLFYLMGIIIGLTLATGFSWVQLMDKIGHWIWILVLKAKDGLWFAIKAAKNGLVRFLHRIKARREQQKFVAPVLQKKEAEQPKEPTLPTRLERVEPIDNEPTIALSVAPKPKKTPLKTINKLISKNKNKADQQLPDVMLLAETSNQVPIYSEADLAHMSQEVEARLLDFGIEVKVVGVLPGPVVTRFELSLAAGLKVSKISTLAKDLARSLSVISVRVVEVIPGKSVVGLEIPNHRREIVRLRDIVQSTIYQQAESPLTLALGKDIAGEPVTAELNKMPHLLVAGTTGSGKSVGINAMLLSILYKALPDEVRLILIDPKMLELSIYEGIPHLLTPVVTDMKDAAHALRWCVAEMERRYQVMATMGVRNLQGYNKKVKAAIDKGEPLIDPLYEAKEGETPPTLEKLPYVVVIIDEFADMIMVVGKKVEELIARIAQKARAAGIHLILATQRPSVDVITGLIKANVPSRIAFQVSSKIDSRTILDQQGAEQLLGHGDMLYLAPGSGIPQRVHGAFVSDEEVHNVVEELKKQGTPVYIDDLQGGDGLQPFSMAEEAEDQDELYDQAVFIVTESRKASISHLQRRLKIGYNRAARLIEEMEGQGIVTAMQPGGGREVIAPPPVKGE